MTCRESCHGVILGLPLLVGYSTIFDRHSKVNTVGFAASPCGGDRSPITLRPSLFATDIFVVLMLFGREKPRLPNANRSRGLPRRKSNRYFSEGLFLVVLPFGSEVVQVALSLLVVFFVLAAAVIITWRFAHDPRLLM
jgi:hypothetical protein